MKFLIDAADRRHCSGISISAGSGTPQCGVDGAGMKWCYEAVPPDYLQRHHSPIAAVLRGDIGAVGAKLPFDRCLVSREGGPRFLASQQ